MMVSEHSYTITLSNNRTEKAAIEYVRSQDDRFWIPESPARKSILHQLGLPARFARAFDLIHVSMPLQKAGVLDVAELDTATLIELKTTRKRLPELPRGFFFGATQNEFELAEVLGERFKFCFVCLHEDTPGFCLLSLGELEPLIRTKRTQYQINL